MVCDAGEPRAERFKALFFLDFRKASDTIKVEVYLLKSIDFERIEKVFKSAEKSKFLKVKS